MKTLFYTFSSVFIISLISLIGIVTLAINESRLKKVLVYFVSFAVGALFGDVFLHIIPEIFEEAASPRLVSFGILGGLLLFFMLEKFVYWRHCHSGTCDFHTKPLVWMNLVGDGLHNFIDGIMIAASYMVSIPLGLATTLAVIFHEIPQEIGDYGILIHGGLSRWRALFLNFVCALFSFIGASLALAIGPRIEGFSFYALSFTAGGFIYIAGVDLIPELHQEVNVNKSLGQLVSILLGIAAMALLLLME